MIPTPDRDTLARSYLGVTFAVARECAPRWLHDEADSVALVGLAQAIREWPDDYDPGRFKPWLRTIVRRRVYDMLECWSWTRRPVTKKRVVARLSLHLINSDAEPAMCVAPDLSLDERDAFDWRIAGLRAADQRLLRLRCVEGWTLTEIARAERIDKSSMSRRYRRAAEIVAN
jgi:RNA polymerase sigma factor (sigma-70 family)